MHPFPSGMLAQAGGSILRPQDVFAASVYTGTGSDFPVANGVDLASRGGLIWEKSRNNAYEHILVDSVRGNSKFLRSNSTAAEGSGGGYTFGASGYTSPAVNSGAGVTMSGLAFARRPGFFDIVTWIGDGVAGRQIPHGLGVAVGMVSVKRLDTTSNWTTWHRSLAVGATVFLNQPTASGVYGGSEIITADGSSFTVGAGSNNNAAGGRYVAYIWAHNPDPSGIIQCGSYASNAETVTLGWKPQLVLRKRANVSENWDMFDAARGFAFTLQPNTPNGEVAATSMNGPVVPTSTGFTSSGGGGGPYLWLAIREPY
ncbi:DUF7483 domain-containing protein [Methylobacterium soli]|uniref:DUF7483 domain-containing protein n=1 Tax=Methylobacterium soli TaxID=553447 RepID=A0A6L3T749_9HYPH|nr:hypothetical protein [Methylobacterium soli]KAB1079328.1 hypothetical protein F6X53_11000 [Methylobacterium soli]GJE42970.1 hypothetical protein AEGHOMDF_2146 [Methylobacterium soli]